MFLKKIKILILLFSIVSVPEITNAKTIANVISCSGNVTKIDMTNNSIISQGQLEKITKIEESFGNVAYSAANNNLLIVNMSHGIQSVFAYDSKTFQFKKDLGLQSQCDDENTRVFYSPNQTIISVSWFSKVQGIDCEKKMLSIYDGNTLNKVREINNTSLSQKINVSKNDLNIYEFFDAKPIFKINIYRVSDLVLQETINLENYVSAGAFSREIKDWRDTVILIVDNMKVQKNDLSKYSIYTFDLNMRIVSPKIATGLRGQFQLFPNGNKVALSEEQNISQSSLAKIISLGKIHIYDLKNSSKIAEIVVDNSTIGRILGVTPDEQRLIYFSEKPDATNSKVTIIDLNNYSKVAEIPVPIDSFFVTFYNE